MRADDFFRELEAENPLSRETAAAIDAPFILAANVYRIRKALGLSQSALARALGVTQPRIAQIERGDANLRIGTLARLALALNCDMRDLLSPLSEARSEPEVDVSYRAGGVPIAGVDGLLRDLEKGFGFGDARNDNFALAA
jgi:transcriptional regulator with XRE-family HTH domain